MVKDKIAELINAIKNGGKVGREIISVPESFISENILNVLKSEGFIKSYTVKGKKPEKIIEVELAYIEGRPRVNGAKRLSSMSKRVYWGAKSIFSFKNGRGIRVISTPRGVFGDKEARRQRVGGEVLFEIW